MAYASICCQIWMYSRFATTVYSKIGHWQGNVVQQKREKLKEYTSIDQKFFPPLQYKKIKDETKQWVYYIEFRVSHQNLFLPIWEELYNEQNIKKCRLYHLWLQHIYAIFFLLYLYLKMFISFYKYTFFSLIFSFLYQTIKQSSHSHLSLFHYSYYFLLFHLFPLCNSFIIQTKCKGYNINLGK